MTKGRFIFLGTGGSMGTPIIGCGCPVCKSSAAPNKRLRPSALIIAGDRQILLDCGPDFRLQALTHDIRNVDGVVFTHAHHDHTAGLDELRVFTLRSGKPLPCLLSGETLQDLKARFYYIFKDSNESFKLTANIAPMVLSEPSGIVNFQGLKVQYNSYVQGGMSVNGFRFGDLAYLTDLCQYDDSVFDMLKNLNTLIISALRFTPSHLHLSVDQALDFAARVNAKHTWFTHIAHELDHEKTNAYLPPNVRLAYDGLEVQFNAEWDVKYE